MSSPGQAAAVPRIAISQVNGRHRILVIPGRASWAEATSGLMNVELPVSGNAASWFGVWLGEGVTARRCPAGGLAGQASREQPYLSCALYCRGPILSLELGVDVADVGVDGVHRDR